MRHQTRSFYFSVSGTDLDVDQVVKTLAQYGITNTTVHRVPISEISVELINPTPEQLKVVQTVFSSIVDHQLRTFEQRIGLPSQPLTRGYPRIEELPSAGSQQYSTKRSSFIPVSSRPHYQSPRDQSPLRVRGQIKPPSNIQFTVPSLKFDQQV